MARPSPAAFHAKYGGTEISIDVETGRVTGSMSIRALNLIQAWRELNKPALLENWNRAVEKKTLFTIKPLE